MNSIAAPAEKTTSVIKPGQKPKPRRDAPPGDWLCAGCLNRVAREEDRFAYDGKIEFSFTNPEGLRFDILTFSQTVGCQEIGVPTFEHTWFPEHAWSFCQCDRCHLHLGWCYTGPHEFTGLIKGRLVSGRGFWN